jgi:hypothetical protein
LTARLAGIERSSGYPTFTPEMASPWALPYGRWSMCIRIWSVATSAVAWRPASADRGLVAIPGSRGDFSYLVEPLPDRADVSLHSLAHGAGRRWSRTDAHARLSRRFVPPNWNARALAAA